MNTTTSSHSTLLLLHLRSTECSMTALKIQTKMQTGLRRKEHTTQATLVGRAYAADASDAATAETSSLLMPIKFNESRSVDACTSTQVGNDFEVGRSAEMLNYNSIFLFKLLNDKTSRLTRYS